MNLPTLDTVVLNTINTYEHAENLPQIDLSQFHAPLVVGSGNGIATGKILFRNVPAFFASESEVAEKLRNIPSIEEVVVVSASGEKHAPIILELAKEMGKKAFLISSSEESSARTIADTSFVFPKITEPYTYNTSTYFGYLYGTEANRELSKLRDHITQTIDTILSNVDWKSYTGYIVVLPNEFALLRDMIEMKFIELFGRKLARDVFTYEQMKHAITVVPDDRELFLCFGNESWIQYWPHQVNLPIFDSVSYAAMMLVGYYTVWKIQRALPSYFMNSIEKYCETAPEKFGFHPSPIVQA